MVRVTAANVHVLKGPMAAWREDVEEGWPLWARLEDGAAVAVCCSVRRSEHAHEAGVETRPDRRGLGYGSAVTAAWIRGMQALRVLPIYSTSWENEASRGVARRLALVPFGTDYHLT